jgi:hypothetical protein
MHVAQNVRWFWENDMQENEYLVCVGQALHPRKTAQRLAALALIG